MAANTCTSSTSTITGTDPTFTLTHRIANKASGAYLYIKYALGTSTSVTITPKSICSILSSSDQYSLVQESSATLSALVYTLTAAGNYKVPLPLNWADSTLVVVLVFNASAQGGSLVANIIEE